MGINKKDKSVNDVSAKDSLQVSDGFENENAAESADSKSGGSHENAPVSDSVTDNASGGVKDGASAENSEKGKAKEKSKAASGSKGDASVKSAKSKHKKSKYKLQPMDIITMIFTAAIIGIMIYVIYDQFSAQSGKGGNTSVVHTPSPGQSQTSAGSSTPAPTAAPVLSDIGNNYGNISNGATVALTDKTNREYFISTGSDGLRHIFVTANGSTKSLIQTNASSINVINDYIGNAEADGANAYYVFYINGDGKICYVYDTAAQTSSDQSASPTEQPSSGSTADSTASVSATADSTAAGNTAASGNNSVGDSSPAALEEHVFKDGKYKIINVSGEYVYYLSESGVIGKVSILDNKETVLSSERTYNSFCLYYGVIYALGADDGYIYHMPSNPQTADASSSASPSVSPIISPEASPAATGADSGSAGESQEKLLINEACTSFAIDNDWIYALTDNGIARYVVDSGAKDTLLNVKADALNVRNSAIYYISNGKLYCARNAENIIQGKTLEVDSDFAIDVSGGEMSGSGICIHGDSVYILKNGILMKSTYDKDNGVYSALTAMN